MTVKKAPEKADVQTTTSIEVDADSRTAQVNITGKFDSEGLISLAKQITRAQGEVV